MCSKIQPIKAFDRQMQIVFNFQFIFNTHNIIEIFLNYRIMRIHFFKYDTTKIQCNMKHFCADKC